MINREDEIKKENLENYLKKDPQEIEKNITYFYFFAFIWAIFFIIQYYFFNGIPHFISNDSFQYLSIAKDIYRDKKSTGLIN